MTARATDSGGRGAAAAWPRGLVSAALAMACVATFGGRSQALVQAIPFEYPSMSFWSGVMAPWGTDKVPDWVIADGGNPGQALRITTALNRRQAVREIRTIHFNHEPGTAARIQVDVKPVAHPPGARFQIRWFDGYVSAEAFDAIADDEFAPFPAPILEITAPPARPEWQHVDVRTPALSHSVLTLALAITQPDGGAGEGEQAFIDYLLDNLSVEVTPLSQLMDPGFDWHGEGGSTMVNWRQTTAGAHVDWCDFMEESDFPWPDGSGRVLHFTLDSFRDHGLVMRVHKDDYDHNRSLPEVGGASVIVLKRNQPGHVPASFGVRQTVSYAALGLGPDDEAHLAATIKCTVVESGLYRGSVQGIIVLQLGCDPKGGILTEDAVWTEPDKDVVWDRDGWKHVTVEWDRPKGAAAFTVFFRARDGECRFKHSIDCTTEPRVMYLGSSSVADWIVVKATKK